MRLPHLHPVLGKGSRLVGADNGGGTHGFAGVHLAHQIVALKHTAHAQCKAQSDAHGQTFGHRYHNKCHGKHHSDHGIVDELHAEQVVGRIVEYSQTSDHDESTHNVAAIGNHLSEAVELLHERRLYVVLNLRLHIHFAIFGAVAHSLHAHNAVTLSHSGSAQHHIGGVGGIFLEVSLDVALLYYGFAGKSAFVHA